MTFIGVFTDTNIAKFNHKCVIWHHIKLAFQLKYQF